MARRIVSTAWLELSQPLNSHRQLRRGGHAQRLSATRKIQRKTVEAAAITRSREITRRSIIAPSVDASKKFVMDLCARRLSAAQVFIRTRESTRWNTR